jgi:DNA invertase Pin-like site-specific DNA recombinase
MQELHDLALKSGYSENDIIPVAEKESGIKLSEEERAGLNRMKELIETGEYDCVFAWEISRIARRKKILFSILEYLIDRKIQLVIKEPYIHLLKANGTIDEGAETIFTLYAQLAETEMRNKMSRFKRAKEEGFAKGKYEGGRITIGYRVNSDGFWEVDPEGSEFIRLIFSMYISGEYSMTELAKELLARGYFYNRVNKGKENVQLSVTTVKNELFNILKDTKYRGGPSEKNKNNYPQIIDDATWELAEKRRKENRFRPKAKGQYLLTPLIRCECGASYSVNRIDASYVCRVKHNSVEKGLKHSPSILASLIESLAWFVALVEFQSDNADKAKDIKEKNEDEIKVLESKISNSEQIIATMRKRRERLDNDFYVNATLSEEKYDELSQKQRDTIQEERKKIQSYQGRIKILQEQIEHSITFDEMFDSLKNKFDSLKEGTDYETMKAIIRRYIVEIRIEPIEGKKTSWWKKVIINTVNTTENLKKRDLLLDMGQKELAETYTNEFYVDSYHHLVYYDKDCTNYVPYVFIDRIPRTRKDERKGRKRNKTIQHQY